MTKLVNNKAKNNSADSIDSMYLNNYDDMTKDEIKANYSNTNK